MRTLVWYTLQVLFAPGVIVHEFAHYLTCKLLRIPVYEVRLFSFGATAGYVEHAVPKSYTKRLLVALAPFVVNLAVATAAFWTGAQLTGPVVAVPLAVGVVVVAHSLPSSTDARTLFPHSTLGYLYPLFLLSVPLILALLLANWLRPYGFGVVYTLGVAGGLALVFYTDISLLAELQSLLGDRLGTLSQSS
jgi:hypothetical protein